MSVMFARSKRSKYGAIPTTVDGIRFDSKAEAKRYGELKLMQKAGEIYALEVHPRYPLFVGDKRLLLGYYVADFAYMEPSVAANEPGDMLSVRGSYPLSSSTPTIEDVKGVITPLAKWKIKHCELQYGIKVRIIR